MVIYILSYKDYLSSKITLHRYLQKEFVYFFIYFFFEKFHTTCMKILPSEKEFISKLANN